MRPYYHVSLTLLIVLQLMASSNAYAGSERTWKTPHGVFRLVTNFGICDSKVHRKLPAYAQRQIDRDSKKYRVPFMLGRCDMACSPRNSCMRIPLDMIFSVRVRGKRVFMHIRQGRKHVVIEHLKDGQLKDVTPKAAKVRSVPASRKTKTKPRKPLLRKAPPARR